MANRHKHIYRTGITAAIALIFLTVAIMAFMIHTALTPKVGDIAPRYPVTEPSDVYTLGSPITDGMAFTSLMDHISKWT